MEYHLIPVPIESVLFGVATHEKSGQILRNVSALVELRPGAGVRDEDISWDFAVKLPPNSDEMSGSNKRKRSSPPDPDPLRTVMNFHIFLDNTEEGGVTRGCIRISSKLSETSFLNRMKVLHGGVDNMTMDIEIRPIINFGTETCDLVNLTGLQLTEEDTIRGVILEAVGYFDCPKRAAMDWKYSAMKGIVAEIRCCLKIKDTCVEKGLGQNPNVEGQAATALKSNSQAEVAVHSENPIRVKDPDNHQTECAEK